MAGTHLIVEVTDAEARAALTRAGNLDVRTVVPRLGEYMLRATKDRFSTQTAPDGTPWQALKPRYAKRKKYHGDKVLTLRGYLRSGIRYQREGDAAVIGTNSPYAAIHQLGGSIQMPARQAKVRLRSVAGKILFAKSSHKKAVDRDVTIPAHEVNMPARPFLGVSTNDRKNITDIVRDWINERLAR